MKPGYTYVYVQCARCGLWVAANWLVRHRKSGCQKGGTIRYSVMPTCSHPELRFDTLGLRCVCCGYVFPTVAPVTITSSST